MAGAVRNLLNDREKAITQSDEWKSVGVAVITSGIRNDEVKIFGA